MDWSPSPKPAIISIGDARLREFHRQYHYIKKKLEDINRLAEDIEQQLSKYRHASWQLRDALRMLDQEAARLAQGVPSGAGTTKGN
jgi:prefoldin subunit 5